MRALIGGDDGRGSFLEYLLVAALERAIALAEMDRVALAVAKNLELDVARVAEIFLHVDGGIAERRLRLGAGLLHLRLELVLRLDDLHASPAATGGCLDEHRIADLGGDLLGLADIGDRAVRAGHERQAELGRSKLRLDLVAHRADMLGLRADPDDLVALHDLGKAGILGQEAVAGMDRIGAADLGGGDDVRDVEIGVGGRRWSDADGMIREADVHRVGVRRRMDGNGLDAHFMTRAVNAQRDLATIGDQDFLNGHRRLLDDDERLIELDGLTALDQDLRHPAGLRRDDRVHHLHRLDDQQRISGGNLLAGRDEWRGAGARA